MKPAELQDGPGRVSRTPGTALTSPERRAAIRSLVAELDASAALRGVTALRHFPAAPGDYRDFPEYIDERLRDAFRRRGVEQLYSHQREVLDRVEAGENVAAVTPTASGKTLCYNVPVLNRILREPDARALYLFPTKALSQDQKKEILKLKDLLGEDIRADVYDGDTPGDARRSIRTRAHIVVTNPDMLHSGILPHHTKWAKLFENLRFVVIDEMHTYRGVFGSHLANLLRRLRRVCAHYRADPQFILSSATIANPRELAEGLTERSISLVDRSGAPRPERFFLFYNPPVVNPELGIRRSALNETRRIAGGFLKGNLQTIVFARSRTQTEVLVKYLKQDIETRPDRSDRIRGYRGGYLPRKRREIEDGIKSGSVLGVVSTNALELGIDIGGLDVAVISGYPGTIASTWQQAGRAGRRGGTAAAVLVANSTPINQFVIQHPDYFFEGTPERGLINPENLSILIEHLKCAAFELPFRKGESFGAEDLEELLGVLEEERILYRAGDRWFWTADFLSGQQCEPALHQLGQLRGARPRERTGHRGGGFRERALDPPRKGDLHARERHLLRRAVGSPGAPRRGPSHRKRLLHRCGHPHEGECPRHLQRGAGAVLSSGPRRGSRRQTGRRLQENQVLHERKRRVR